jgi:hypothetical protein
LAALGRAGRRLRFGEEGGASRLAKPGLEGDDFAALPSIGDVGCFHRVMSLQATAERTARVPTVAYAAGWANIVSPPVH